MPSLAAALGKLRAAAKLRGLAQAPKDLGAVRVRLHELELVERELRVVVPDPVLAYVAAGVSIWGDGPVRLGDVVERTLALWENSLPRDLVVIDDDSNGNFIAFRRGEKGDRVWFVDHEGGPRATRALSLAAEVERRADASVEAAPVVIELDDAPLPPPPARTVRHPKFGRGTVVAEADDVVTVRFDGVGEKRLKRSFLTFE